jgi:NADH:ubiquinone oxidoreductase subunit 6 (subunit J)
MWYILIVAGILVCALEALLASRLLYSALWLAGTSALTALIIFLLGAPEIAVIELSVGAGLVTVLFVFAINIAGEEALPLQHLIPRPVAMVLIGVALILLGWFILPGMQSALSLPQVSQFGIEVWDKRSLDVLLQVVLIFAGVLGILGLLAEDRPQKNEEKKS